MRVLQVVHSYEIDGDPKLNGYIILTDDEQIVTQNISEQGVDDYLEYVFTIPTALEKAIPIFGPTMEYTAKEDPVSWFNLAPEQLTTSYTSVFEIDPQEMVVE
jgi:hypothetical protein